MLFSSSGRVPVDAVAATCNRNSRSLAAAAIEKVLLLLALLLLLPPHSHLLLRQQQQGQIRCFYSSIVVQLSL